MNATHPPKDPLSQLHEEYRTLEMPQAVRNRIEAGVFAKGSAPRPALSLRLAAAIALLMLIGFGGGYLVFSKAKDQPILTRVPSAHTSYSAVIARVEGRASVTEPTSKKREVARKRMSVDTGGGVETAKRSNAELVIGPHRARISGETDLMLSKLDRSFVELSLRRGAVNMDVAPLTKEEKLVVRAGELSVFVIGTIFRVERDDDCAEVSVDEGRVRAEYKGQSVFVAANQSRRFCENETQSTSVKAAEPEETAPETAAPPIKEPEREAPRPRRIVSAKAENEPSLEQAQSANAKKTERTEALDIETEPSPAPAPKIGEQALTGEERAFKNALSKIKERDREGAKASLREYLSTYPGGAFTSDALFQLIRLEYRTGRFAEIPALARKYESLGASGDQRAAEVDIIHAQALLELQRNASKAYELLSGVLRIESSVPRAYREQAVYLYVLASFRTGREDVGRTWARKYLDEYPQGRYAKQAGLLLEKK